MVDEDNRLESNDLMNKLSPEIILWGGTGQAKVVRQIIEYYKSKISAVIDDTPGLESPFHDVSIYQGKEGFLEYIKNKNKEEIGFLVTIGNDKTCRHAKARRSISEFLIEHGLKPITLVHPTAFIDNNVQIGIGAQILAGAKIITKTKIGDYCIINTGASIDHDCILGDSVEIGPGAVLCGEIKIGENSWIGANATILPRIKIGANSVVGAGAVVTKDISGGVVVVGNPARVLRKIK